MRLPLATPPPVQRRKTHADNGLVERDGGGGGGAGGGRGEIYGKRVVARALGNGTVTGITLFQAGPMPTATTSSAPASTTSGQAGYGLLVGDRSQILDWAAIGVVFGLILIIAAWRMSTARNKTMRGFLLPRGIHIRIRGKTILKIKPPPIVEEPMTMAQLEARRAAERRARRAEERFQRRRTRGDNIGDGGQRQDGDVYDSDDDDEADRATLPGYKADTRAPVYLEEWRSQAVEEGRIDDVDEDTRQAIRESVAAAGVPVGGPQQGRDAVVGGERILSVEEYEARQRGEEVAPMQNVESREPVVVVHGSRPTSPLPPSSQIVAERAVASSRPPSRPSTPPAAHVIARHLLQRPNLSRAGSTHTVSNPPNYDALSRVPSRSASRSASRQEARTDNT